MNKIKFLIILILCTNSLSYAIDAPVQSVDLLVGNTPFRYVLEVTDGNNTKLTKYFQRLYRGCVAINDDFGNGDGFVTIPIAGNFADFRISVDAANQTIIVRNFRTNQSVKFAADEGEIVG